MDDNETLRISYTQLESLPCNIAQFSHHIIQLDLSNNKIKTLSSEIENLSRLRTLNLENNKLDVLPPGIGKLSRLEYLNVRDNRLTTLPLEIQHLTALETLNLHNNPLTHLPCSIKYLHSLRFIKLNNFIEISSPKKRVGSLFDTCCEFVAAFVQPFDTYLPIDILTRLKKNGTECEECGKIVYSDNRMVLKHWKERWHSQKIVFGEKLCLRCVN